MKAPGRFASLRREAYGREPSRGTEFSLEGLEGYSLRFVVEEGKVTEAVFIQPNGVFSAARK